MGGGGAGDAPIKADGPVRRPAEELGGGGVGEAALPAEVGGGGGAGDGRVRSRYVPDPIDVCANLVGESRTYESKGEPATPNPVFPWHEATINALGESRQLQHLVNCIWESELFYADPYPECRVSILATPTYVELRIKFGSGSFPTTFYRIDTADFKPQGDNVLTFYSSAGLFGWPATWNLNAVLVEKPLYYEAGGGGVGDGGHEFITVIESGGGGAGGGGGGGPAFGGGGVSDGGYEFPAAPVSTGLTLPGTGQVYTPPSEVTWSSPNNVTSLGAPLSGASLFGSNTATDQSRLLVARNFGFAIPSGATILGVEAELLGHWQFAAGNVTLCQLFAGGVVIGSDNKASASGAFPLGSPASAVAFGGSADLWGAALTPAIVNDSGFGVAFAVDAVGLSGLRLFYMYTMRLSITYTT